MEKKRFIGRISTALTALMFGISTLSVPVGAADVKVQMKDASDDGVSGEMAVVTEPVIGGLGEPVEGKALDESALVTTAEGLSWSIPVIWLDENGQKAEVCMPGKKYIPSFAFYLPEGVTIAGETEYSIELPEFVGKMYGEKGLISVVDPASSIIYLTTPEVAELDGNSSFALFSVKSAKNTASSYYDTYISRRDIDWEYLAEQGYGLSDVQAWIDSQNEWNYGASDWEWLDTSNYQYQSTAVDAWLNGQGAWNLDDATVQAWLGSQNYQYQSTAVDSWLNSQNAWNLDDATVQAWLGSQNYQYQNSSVQSWLGGQNAWNLDDATVQAWLGSQNTYGLNLSDAAIQEWTNSYYSQGSYSWQGYSNYGNTQTYNNGSGSGQESSTDAVSIHCTSGAISVIGRDNLQNLVHIIKDVIEPQAVYQLTTKFDSFAGAAKNGELGTNIGLYIYNSTVDSESDVKNGAAYSYCLVSVSKSSMEYFIGVDTNSFYHVEGGSYVLNDNAFEELSNSLTHELMHAFMYDYTRSGMVGFPDKDNMFPEWFIEGIATTVDEAYSYQKDVYRVMMTGDASGYSSGDYLKGYTAQSILSFYNGGVSVSEVGDPRLTNTGTEDQASNYTTGYLACVYLGSMAAEKAGKTVTTTSNGVTTYNSEAIRSGLDTILKELHNGTSLDAVIRDVSDGAYSGIDDFEEKFLKGTNSGGTYVTSDAASLNFTLGYLNYLNDVSVELTSANKSELVLATGSLLLPLDSAERTPIEEQLPAGMPQQQVYNIIDSKDWVASTVDPQVALASAGTYETGDGSGTDSRVTMAARAEEYAELLSAEVQTLNGMTYEEIQNSLAAAETEPVHEVNYEDIISAITAEYPELTPEDIISAYTATVSE